MNIDVAPMNERGEIDWGDLAHFKITFEPKDFDPETKPSRAPSTLTCIGCTDETQTMWKLETEDKSHQYVVSGNVIYDALITRMLRLKRERGE